MAKVRMPISYIIYIVRRWRNGHNHVNGKEDE
jgi:hypothetical protein